jgi:hypothetical protein
MATYTEHNSAAPAPLETNRIEWFVGPKFSCDGPLSDPFKTFRLAMAAIKAEQSEHEDPLRRTPLGEPDFRFAEASSETIDR